MVGLLKIQRFEKSETAAASWFYFIFFPRRKLLATFSFSFPTVDDHRKKGLIVSLLIHWACKYLLNRPIKFGIAKLYIYIFNTKR